MYHVFLQKFVMIENYYFTINFILLYYFKILFSIIISVCYFMIYNSSKGHHIFNTSIIDSFVVTYVPNFSSHAHVSSNFLF